MAETFAPSWAGQLSAEKTYRPQMDCAATPIQKSGLNVLMDRTSKNLGLSGDILSRLIIIRDRLYGSRPEAADKRAPEAPPNGAMEAFSNQIKLQSEALEAINQLVIELSGL